MAATVRSVALLALPVPNFEFVHSANISVSCSIHVPFPPCNHHLPRREKQKRMTSDKITDFKQSIISYATRQNKSLYNSICKDQSHEH